MDNVKATCNGSDQVERVKAQARSQVYMAGNAERNIRGAQKALGTGDGVVYVWAQDARSGIFHVR